MDTRRYNDQIRYTESELTVRSVLSDKNSILHKRMYDVALSRLLESLGLSESDCYIKEIPAKNYLEPSSVMLSLSAFPFTTTTYSLKSFWPEYLLSRPTVSNLPSGVSEAASEIISKDFIYGTAKIQNKLTSNVVSIDLETVPSDVRLSDTIDLDNLSFSSKMNNDLA